LAYKGMVDIVSINTLNYREVIWHEQRMLKQLVEEKKSQEQGR